MLTTKQNHNKQSKWGNITKVNFHDRKGVNKNIIDIKLSAWVAQWVRSLDLTTHTSLSPIRHGFAPSFVNYKKGCTRLAAASDKVYQLLAQGRWFSPGTLASSTTKTGRHYIAEILLKVALNAKIQIKILLIKCARWVSGINFIKYAQSQKIGKSKNV